MSDTWMWIIGLIRPRRQATNGVLKQEWSQQGALSSCAVKCDASNNPPSETLLGKVNIEVTAVSVDPAEFIIVQIQQASGASTS